MTHDIKGAQLVRERQDRARPPGHGNDFADLLHPLDLPDMDRRTGTGKCLLTRGWNSQSPSRSACCSDFERERSKGEGPGRRPAGIRTFALATLLGALATYLGGTLLLATATGAVAIFAAFSYPRTATNDPGLTTAMGLVLAPLLGGLAMSEPLLAAATAATMAALFAAKAPLHRFVKNVLTEAEITDALIFAVATLVIWPQLPNRYLGPFDALNPHNLWLLVILMLAISACGHIATRMLGARYGLPLAGLVSGFVSSTATIGSMAARAARTPSAMGAAVAGAALSTVATFVQMALLLLAISRPVLNIMWPALLAGGLTAIAYALYFTLRSLASKNEVIPEEGRPFLRFDRSGARRDYGRHDAGGGFSQSQVR